MKGYGDIIFWEASTGMSFSATTTLGYGGEVIRPYTTVDLHPTREHKIRCEYCRQKQDIDNNTCEFCGAPLPDEDPNRRQIW